MNELSDFFKSKQDREDLQKIEQLRRKGERFIKVRYNGSVIPRIDSEGVCYNIRIQGLRDIEAYEQTDISTGKLEWKTRPGARALTFRQSPTGDIEANIWDDPDKWNRHFIATHPEFEILDEKLKDEIEKTKKQPFKAELSRKEELERKIAADLKELEAIENEEKAEEVKEGESTDGIDESTPDVDSPGVLRVESRRGRKRHTPAV